MSQIVDLAQLRERLAKLGVHISETSHTEAPASSAKRAELAPQATWDAHLERNTEEVAQLLERCNKVHRALCKAEKDESEQQRTAPAATEGVILRRSALAPVPAATKAARAAASAAAQLSSNRSEAGPGKHGSTQQTAADTADAGKRASHATDSSRLIMRTAKKLVEEAQTKALQLESARRTAPALKPVANRAAANAAEDIRSSPLGTVLAQYKEAQAAWAQEKAKLRRDAVTERKKASKLEVELARIQRLHQHKTLDVSSLKAALKGRDQTLEEAHNKVKQLEETLVRSQEVAAEKLCSLASERDDLQALLLATLERLEGVEAVVTAADAASAAMEEKVRVLEMERMAALEAAAAARAEVSQLKEEQKRLRWQSQLLEKMSEVQLRHNKRKSAAIKQLLSSAATGELTGPGASASKKAAMYQSAHVSAETLQDALDELLQTDQSDSEGDHSS